MDEMATLQTVPVRITNVETFVQEVKNWADKWAQPRLVKKTTVKTYYLDPAAVAVGGSRSFQICDYEPLRVRMTIHVVDNAIALTTESPVTSPDTGAVGSAPQGAYLPANLVRPYEFFGPDAFWINSLTTATRVTVVKEYC